MLRYLCMQRGHPFWAFVLLGLDQSILIKLKRYNEARLSAGSNRLLKVIGQCSCGHLDRVQAK